MAEERETAAPRRKKRWIILGVVGVLLIAYIALTLPNWLLLASGDRVDIGGRMMFVSCQGTGSPTVILEHGLAANGTDWEAVQDAIASDTRVCFSSRAGMGFSDPAEGEGVRTTRDSADDLENLLTAAGIDPPYLTVGHSIGGFVIRLYRDRHPDDVVGMVLVDTSHQDQLRLLEDNVSPDAWEQVAPLFGADNPERLDLEASAAEMGSVGNLGDLPLVVIQADAEVTDADTVGVSQAIVDEVDRVSNELAPRLQAELAGLSTNSTLIFAEGSGHFVHVDRPEVVIDAIRSLLP